MAELIGAAAAVGAVCEVLLEGRGVRGLGQVGKPVFMVEPMDVPNAVGAACEVLLAEYIATPVGGAGAVTMTGHFEKPEFMAGPMAAADAVGVVCEVLLADCIGNTAGAVGASGQAA